MTMETSKSWARYRTANQRKQNNDGGDGHHTNNNNNNICSCKENGRTKQQTSGECLKYLCSCMWRGGGLDKHLATTLTDCQASSEVSLSLIYSVCLLSCLTLHPLNYLSVYLSPLLHPFLIQLSTCVLVSLYVPEAGKGWGHGVGLEWRKG